jgi:diguanylate cyclase (GGDEF)-like protein
LSFELTLARIALLLVQSGLAFTLSLILWHFYRIYHRHYLKSWAIAFALYSAYMLLFMVYTAFVVNQDVYPIFRTLNELAYIFCGYAFAIWILVGVREAVATERVASRLTNQLLGLVALITLCSVLFFVPENSMSMWKIAVQVNLRLLFIGSTLLVSGFWLFSITTRLFVTRAVATVLLLWGLQMVILALMSSWLGQGEVFTRISTVTKHIELLWLSLLGMGLIVWLQDDERTANQQLTAKTQYLDSHDQLTGALNRDALLQELNFLLAKQPSSVLLVMVGLDRFKNVNESVGIKQGDRILREVNRRFEASVLKPSLIARSGGDIFVLVLEDIETEKQRQFCLQHIEHLIEKPFNFDSGLLKLTATLGVAQYPEHAKAAETLLQKANIAFHQAKRLQQRWVQYSVGMEEESARLLSMEKELLLAMSQQQFVLYFQPQFNLREQRIDGFEALVRWQHPEKGLLMPGQFLPQMEQLGLMRELDFQLLEIAVATLGRWRKLGIQQSIAVNMTPIHFEQPGLKARIQMLLEQYQVPTSLLELEITENTAMGDMEQGSNFVAELQQMGIRVSIDDFGTGYSSLGYLRRMPIDKIKIDRSFIMDMAGSDSDMMIVKTMITLAHGLGKRILAEGVEDENQLGLLKRMSCDAVQGYLIAKPLPEAEAIKLLINSAEKN